MDLRGGLQRGARAIGRGLSGGGLEAAYLTGRGEYGAAAQSRAQQEEMRRYQEQQGREQAALAELEGIDPTSAEGNAEAFRVFTKYGLLQHAQAIATYATATQAQPPVQITEGVRGNPKLRRDSLYTRGGAPVYEGVPYEPSASTQINMGEAQKYSVEDRMRGQYETARKPLDERLEYYRSARAIYEAMEEGREPTQAEAMGIMRAGLRMASNEAINEQDVINTVGGSLGNIARRKAGLPMKISRAQLDEQMLVMDRQAQQLEQQIGDLGAQFGEVSGRRGLPEVARPTDSPRVPSDGAPAGLPEGAAPIGQLGAGQWLVKMPDGQVLVWEPD